MAGTGESGEGLECRGRGGTGDGVDSGGVPLNRHNASSDERGSNGPHPVSFWLGAGRSQVQILSPRSRNSLQIGAFQPDGRRR